MKKKNLIIYLLLISLSSILLSCAKEEVPAPVNELSGLQKVTGFMHGGHTVSLYTASGQFTTGYNRVYLQIKKSDSSLATNAQVSWQPVMKMMGMSHSSPYSPVTKKQGTQATYEGFIVFQMAGNDMEYWELTINYTLDGVAYTAKQRINVTASPLRKVNSFLGSDGKRYVLAIVEPLKPRVAINDMSAILYRMENMMLFVPVANYSIKIDPRMPGMGNHGSPNNIALTQGADGNYHGKLSLTMTGLWKINLQLLNEAQQIVKGEEVTDNNPASSIYFEIEF